MVASASLSIWGTWRTEGLVHTNCGPRSSAATETVPSSDSGGHTTLGSTIPSEYNQCAFIRYYTIRKRGLIPKVIKAGAGPRDFEGYGSGNGSSDSTCLQDSSSETSGGSDVVVYNLAWVRAALIAILCYVQPSKDDADLITELVFQVSTEAP